MKHLSCLYSRTVSDPVCSGSRGEMLFGPDNLGDAAINGFLQKHSCSACCRRLGLEGQKCTKSVCVRERENVQINIVHILGEYCICV